MSDLINRQDAIDALSEDIEDCFVLHDAIKSIKFVPSAQQWIPCSERLPDYHEEVLVTSRGEVSIAWLYIDDNWRSCDLAEQMYKDIVAWMPLPEPWKEDEA